MLVATRLWRSRWPAWLRLQMRLRERSALHLERDLRIHAIAGHLVVFNRGGEFLDVNRANIAQRFGCFADNVLRRFLPAARRFRHYFNDFYNFGHELLFSSQYVIAGQRVLGSAEVDEHALTGHSEQKRGTAQSKQT